MKGANLLARLTGSEGETVAEVFGPPNALQANADGLSRGLYVLSEVVTRAFEPEAMRGFLGGEFGYAVDYENDVFVLHPDYQDVECGCGYEAAAEAWFAAHPHAPHCYSSEYDALPTSKTRPWQKRRSDVKALCKKHGIPWNSGYGCAVHCSCPRSAAWKEWSAANDHDPACDIVRPNFRYKPSGLEVRWYKWIGRDTQANRVVTGGEWADVLAACLDSLPTGAKARAVAAHARESTPEYLAEREQALRAMLEEMSHDSSHDH